MQNRMEINLLQLLLPSRGSACSVSPGESIRLMFHLSSAGDAMLDRIRSRHNASGFSLGLSHTWLPWAFRFPEDEPLLL